MTLTHRSKSGPHSPLRRIVGIAALVVLTLTLAAVPSPGHSLEGDDALGSITGASLSWGIRSTWRDYIGLGPGSPGPGSPGTITSDPPAVSTDDGITTWNDGEGQWDSNTGTVAFRGTMTLKGHPGSWYPNGWGMVQSFSDPEVTFTSNTTATMTIMVTQASVVEQWPTITDPTRIRILDLTFAAGDLDDRMATSRSATLTQEGADLWGNYGSYVAGTAMDPVTVSLGDAPIVEPAATSTRLHASSATIYEGDSVDLSAEARVNDDAESTGPVKGEFLFFMDGDQVAAVPAREARATFTASKIPLGDHTFVAEFRPESTEYAGSRSSEVTVSVDRRAPATTVEGSLEWGVRQSFRTYVVGPIAHGAISTSGGATQAPSNGAFTFPQASGQSQWNGTTGSIQYAGSVRFTGHQGVLDVAISNPVISVTSATSAQLRVPFGPKGSLITLATLDLGAATRQELPGGAVRFGRAPAVLDKQGEQFFSDPTGQGSSSPFYAAGTEMDRVTFTIGAPSKYGADHTISPTPKPGSQATQSATPEPRASSTAAGSLRWGVSDYFTQYTTRRSGSGCPTPSQHCAGGSISTSGVGQGWLFPQAEGGSWDPETQTGSVRFSGVVTFSGYGQTMFQVANPTITIIDARSATMNTGYSGPYGPGSVTLNLAAATKSEADGGAVTWTNVPVSGQLAGISAGQGISFDPLTLTVGTASDAEFGNTAVEEEETTYQAADTAPSTTGLEILTAAEDIKPGGRLQIRGSGFTANDEGILVVLYEGDGTTPGPVIIGEDARADDDGTVLWSGMLPRDREGAHVITLQGSSAVGAPIVIGLPTQLAGAQAASPEAAGSPLLSAVAPSQPAGPHLWEWWVSAGALVAIAACTTVLAIRQRRSNP